MKLFGLICALSLVIILIANPFKKDVVSGEDADLLDKLYTIEEEVTIALKLDKLTGKMVPEDEEKTYYSVIIDNISYARPQYGLSLAPLVYELPAEGGITRFLAIFDSTDIERIGPVRSARPYFIDKAQEHGLLLVHCGGSPEALSIISKKGYADMDELRYGKYFFRDSDRKAPYNLFVTPESIVTYSKIRGFSLDSIATGFEFASKISEDEGSDGLMWRCEYNNSYSVAWKYSAEHNRYTRFVKDVVHVDQVNQEAITASNVIIQYISYKVLDSEGRLQLSSKNSGSGVVLTSGKEIECTWVTSSSGLTEYFDLDGNKVQLTPGKIWVQTLMESEDVLVSIPLLKG